jgi:hypothetical protein
VKHSLLSLDEDFQAKRSKPYKNVRLRNFENSTVDMSHKQKE